MATDVTSPVITNETGLDMVSALQALQKDATGQSIAAGINKLAGIIAASSTFDFSSWAKVREMQKQGILKYALPVGSYIKDVWTDKATSTAYDILWHVADYQPVIAQSGDTFDAMLPQLHFATPFGVQFSQFQAFYYNDTGAVLPAGTYNVTIPTTWSKATAGTYQFTLTQDLPAGGQLSGFETIADTLPSAWKVKSWTDNAATTPIETVSVNSGSDGTALGLLTPAGDGKLNSIQRVGYGNGRWGHSAKRQWLNSSKDKGSWWKAQNNFDRPPNELATKAGFLSGFSDDFLSVIQPIKVTTALNTVSDSSVGTTEDTYDKIFLPSLQQMYINPQLADVEGTAWEYWRQASGLSAPAAQGGTYPNYITYGADNHASAQYVRLRSANRGNAYSTWYVSSSGTIGSSNAFFANRCAPACAIY